MTSVYKGSCKEWVTKALCQHHTYISARTVSFFVIEPCARDTMPLFRKSPTLFAGDILTVQRREGAWPQFYAGDARLRLRLGMDDWSSVCGLMAARFDHFGKPRDAFPSPHLSNKTLPCLSFQSTSFDAIHYFRSISYLLSRALGLTHVTKHRHDQICCQKSSGRSACSNH
ncbi:hypothetical protein K432DRAFT_1236 [Lepidopterella palustris CBS 459.81]|uniref:Uncharacterized protein n=1 Tax=Lepidopterella palustris CBS 459.81 TaxID=1314670 RepID=A0A8E2EM08_9PEZI|nr:hypothetical protein K432DRAFT_1236 [Lepidopterella palustris CBS 459.81]